MISTPGSKTVTHTDQFMCFIYPHSFNKTHLSRRVLPQTPSHNHPRISQHTQLNVTMTPRELSFPVSPLSDICLCGDFCGLGDPMSPCVRLQVLESVTHNNLDAPLHTRLMSSPPGPDKITGPSSSAVHGVGPEGTTRTLLHRQRVIP